jgi:hypothetical protein
MALPLSGNQLKNLTTRLREGKETPADLHALADVLLYYQRVLSDAHTDIERLCAAMPHAEPMTPRSPVELPEFEIHLPCPASTTPHCRTDDELGPTPVSILVDLGRARRSF